MSKLSENIFVRVVRVQCEHVLSVVDMTPPPTQPISLRLDNVLPVVNPRHVQLLGPQVCTQKFIGLLM